MVPTRPSAPSRVTSYSPERLTAKSPANTTQIYHTNSSSSVTKLLFYRRVGYTSLVPTLGSRLNPLPRCQHKVLKTESSFCTSCLRLLTKPGPKHRQCQQNETSDGLSPGMDYQPAARSQSTSIPVSLFPSWLTPYLFEPHAARNGKIEPP